jgi:hypothetical protein
MFINALSLGPRGWVQVVNFLVLGILIGLFTWRVSVVFSTGKASKVGGFVFLLMPVTITVFLRRFRADLEWQKMVGWTWVLGIIEAVAVVFFTACISGNPYNSRRYFLISFYPLARYDSNRWLVRRITSD